MNFFKDDKHLLSKARDRISYMYIEYARLEQTNYSVAIVQGNNVAEIPITTISAIFLGPGTTITHEAIKNFAAAGVSLIWCGAEEWRMYVAGAPCTTSAKNILIQMRCHESKIKHMDIVRKMFSPRKWGCLSGTGSAPPEVRLFPTQVGVSPVCTRAVVRGRTFPHASGGVSRRNP